MVLLRIPIIVLVLLFTSSALVEAKGVKVRIPLGAMIRGFVHAAEHIVPGMERLALQSAIQSAEARQALAGIFSATEQNPRIHKLLIVNTPEEGRLVISQTGAVLSTPHSPSALINYVTLLAHSVEERNDRVELFVDSKTFFKELASVRVGTGVDIIVDDEYRIFELPNGTKVLAVGDNLAVPIEHLDVIDKTAELLSKPFIHTETTVMSFFDEVADRESVQAIRRAAPGQFQSYLNLSPGDIDASLTQYENKLLLLVGHIEDNKLAIRDAQGSILRSYPIADIQEAARRHHVTAVFLGCESALVQNATGFSTAVNSIEVAGRITKAMQASSFEEMLDSLGTPDEPLILTPAAVTELQFVLSARQVARRGSDIDWPSTLRPAITQAFNNGTGPVANSDTSDGSSDQESADDDVLPHDPPIWVPVAVWCVAIFYTIFAMKGFSPFWEGAERRWRVRSRLAVTAAMAVLFPLFVMAYGPYRLWVWVATNSAPGGPNSAAGGVA